MVSTGAQAVLAVACGLLTNFFAVVALYLLYGVAIGLAWYAIFRVALSVRVGNRLWAPVSDGAWRQVMAIDVLRDFGLPRTGGALLAYGVLSVFLWLIVEILWRRQSLNYWWRAAIARVSASPSCLATAGLI